MKFSLDINELNAAVRSVQKGLAEIPSVMTRVVDEHARDALAVAQGTTPIDTGALMRSGKVTAGKVGGGVEETIEFGSGLNYASMVHDRDHFLYGGSDSGWNDGAEARMVADMEQAVMKHMEDSI